MTIPDDIWGPVLSRACPIWTCRAELELRRHHWRCTGCGLLLPLRFWDPNDWPTPEEG